MDRAVSGTGAVGSEVVMVGKDGVPESGGVLRQPSTLTVMGHRPCHWVGGPLAAPHTCAAHVCFRTAGLPSYPE